MMRAVLVTQVARSAPSGGWSMGQAIRHLGSFLLEVHDRVCKGCFHASAWMMLAMTLIISYEVVVRYFFTRPTMWVADFTDYIMLYSTFLVSAELLKHGGHVRLTILQVYFSPKRAKQLDVINAFIGAIVCGFVLWYGARDVWDAVQKSISIPRPLPVPKYLILWVIPFGCLLLCVQFLRNGFGLLSDLKAGSRNEKVGAVSSSEE